MKSVSSRLAKQGEHSLDGVELVTTALGPPALADALAVFECAAKPSTRVAITPYLWAASCGFTARCRRTARLLQGQVRRARRSALIASTIFGMDCG